MGAYLITPAMAVYTGCIVALGALLVSSSFFFGKDKLQKFKESIEEFIERQEKYNIHSQLFDGRNSYSKTDSDATPPF